MTLRTCTFRPIPYVVPPLYNLCVLFMILYSTANCFRAWIAYEEKKISKPFRLFCQICYVNLAVAGLLFSLCFAVQPTDHESLIVHTGPFAYFTIALVMNQVSIFNYTHCYFTRLSPKRIGKPFLVLPSSIGRES